MNIKIKGIRYPLLNLPYDIIIGFDFLNSREFAAVATCGAGGVTEDIRKSLAEKMRREGVYPESYDELNLIVGTLTSRRLSGE